MVKLLPQKLRNTHDFMDKLKGAAPFSSTARITTFDITAMYDNINKVNALAIMKYWLKFSEDKIMLPEYFCNHKLLLEILDIVMSENIFQNDDLLFLQVLGTAMGTNSAPLYA